MRDSHRFKERVELSLDNRQLVSLVLGGLVLLGSVFVMGIVVGKRLAASERPGAAQPADLLTSIDARSAALAQVQVDSGLTFQDELTRSGGSPSGQARAIELTPPVEPAPTQAAAVERASEREEPSRAGGEIVPARTASRGQEAPPRAPSVPGAAAGEGRFTLQLSASQDRAEAERFVAKLRDRGYAPYVMEATVPGRGTWYRVRMGGFPSRDAAARYLEDFRRETRMDGFVTAN